jgi:hypothetical protein
MQELKPTHVDGHRRGAAAAIASNRPARKNPVTFECYAEPGETFRKPGNVDAVQKVIIARAILSEISGAAA